MVLLKFELAPKLRADLVCYAGINLSGERRVVDIHVVGGRQGADIPTAELKSCSLVAPLGTRMILKTHDGEDWERYPWRCVRVLKGSSFRNSEGNYVVRIPDLEMMDKPEATRTDSEREESYPLVNTLAEGTGWTFGREGNLKGRIQVIAIDKEG